ncbi:MAG: RtcB family protein [Methylocella sp.]
MASISMPIRSPSSLPFFHSHVAAMPRTGSFIVRGRGNPDSFCSCSHGAGRRMSRTEAAHVECRKDVDVIDEWPAAYIDTYSAVIAAQTDLIDVIHRLRGIVNVKGKSGQNWGARLTSNFQGPVFCWWAVTDSNRRPSRCKSRGKHKQRLTAANQTRLETLATILKLRIFL